LSGEDFVAQVDDEKHLLFSCESTKVALCWPAHVCEEKIRNLMQFEDVGSVAWFVHECMERVDNFPSHTGSVEDNVAM
jgi:hypothetical protein